MKNIINIIYKKYDFNNYKDKNIIKMKSISFAIVLNIMLFLGKIILGIYTSSISIISDAFNNLSDSATSIVGYLGFKQSSKPADKEHPYGHGRAENIAALIIGVIIVLLGINFLFQSLSFINREENAIYSTAGVIILIVSIVIKFLMAFYFTTIDKLCNSSVMKASAIDSFNDVLTTSITLFALLMVNHTSLPLDSIGGIVVSLFIIKTGYDTIKEMSTALIGCDVDHEFKQSIIDTILSENRILGVHDVLIHTYGNEFYYGSADVEVLASEELLSIHNIIDNIERLIFNKYNVSITLHLDPILKDSEITEYYRDIFEKIIIDIDPILSYHDFRVVKDDTRTNIILDLEVPYNYHLSNDILRDIINKKLKSESNSSYLIINFDYK